MSVDKKVWGCDPGYFGALALYDPKTKKIDVVYDMPLIRCLKTHGKRVDGHTLARVFAAHGPVAFAAIERVHAMPGQGVVSMFNFGEGYGVIKGVLSALQIPFEDIEPSVWKGVLGLSGDKKKSLELARKIFAGENRFPKTGDHGKAEAALIAKFAAERLGKGYGV